MCVVIIDTNQLHDFIKPDNEKPGMARLRKWIEKKGRVFVYPSSGKYLREIDKYKKAKEKLKDYITRGKAIIVDKEACEKATREFKKRAIKSDDENMLGLAKATHATLLCTKDDDLIEDFKRLIPGGKIYPKTKKAQEDMFNNYKCKNKCP